MAVTRPSARWWPAAGLALLTAVFYAWPLTLDAPLLDPDEGLHAAIAREMVDRGDYLVPRVLGEPFLDKPVLYFWMLAASIRCLGPTEVAVRLPGLVCGWLGALTTWMLARRLLGRGAGDLAYSLAATLALPLAVTQAAVHDVALVPWTNLALLFLWRLDRASTAWRASLAAIAAGGFVGLAILTKGLVGVALVGVPFALWLLVERRLTPRTATLGLVSVSVGVALAAPWYLAMEQARPGYLRYFFVERHLLGFATPTQPHGARAWWYYLPVVLGGGWPWIFYLPSAVRGGAAPMARGGARDECGGREADARRGTRLAWVWLGAGLVLLSAARSKLVTYLLPVMPAIAVLAARAWHARATEQPAAEGWRFAAALWLHAAVGVSILPAAVWIVQAGFQVHVGWPVWLAAVVVAVGYGQALAAGRARAARRTLTWFLALVAVTFIVLMRGLMPAVATELSARDLARRLNAERAWPAAVWVVDERVGSLLFYLDPAHRHALTPGRLEHVPLGRLWPRLKAAAPDVVVVIADRDAPRIERRVRLDGVPFERAGRHRLYRADRLRDRMRAVLGGDPPP